MNKRLLSLTLARRALRAHEKRSSKKDVDWDAIRQRMEEMNEKLTHADELSDEQLEAAWLKRAEQLAREIEEEDKGEQSQVIFIRVGGELYGIDTGLIFDIRPLERIAPVPRVPDWVAGVVNWRGQIISVIDLMRYLGLDLERPEDGNRYLVVVQSLNMEIGLMVDEVVSVESLPISKIEEAVSAVRGIRPEYVQGIYIHKVLPGNRKAELLETAQVDTPVVILDLLAMLADSRLIIQEEIL